MALFNRINKEKIKTKAEILKKQSENLNQIKEQIKENKIEPEDIPIDLIDNPPFHDRTYIDLVSLEDLKENIKQYGLIEPIIVRKKEDGRYERIAGYRRLQAVKKLGWEYIPAVVLDVDEETALAMMLSENIHREDLTDYDKTVAITQYIEYAYGLTEEELKSFFQKITNKLSDRVKSEITDEERKILKDIEEIIKMFRVKGWQTFWMMMRLLNIHPLIKEGIRKYGWKYTIALELNKLRDNEEILKKVINEVVEKDMGYSEVKRLVALYKGEEEKVERFPFDSISKKIRKRWNKLDKEKKEKIDKLFQEILEILEEG